MSLALYAGSFDPITLGHIDIIRQAVRVFDRLFVGVGQNPKKKRLFDGVASVAMIEEALLQTLTKDEFSRVDVGTYCGKLLPDFASEIGANAIVRGLRQASDFNDEFVLHGMMERVAPDLPMAYFICQQQFLHVSSSTARELAQYGANVSWLVTPNVEEALKSAFP